MINKLVKNYIVVKMFYHNILYTDNDNGPVKFIKKN